MKNQFLISIFCFLFSCASGQTLESYVKQEISKNNKLGLECVLKSKKANTKLVLSIYNDLDIKTKVHRLKTFNQDDYLFLIECTKKDTLDNFWNEKDKSNFGFERMVDEKYMKNHNISENEINGKVIYYTLSNPVYLKNEKSIVFLVTKSLSLFQKIDTKIILMKKVKGKWKFFDEIYDLNGF